MNKSRITICLAAVFCLTFLSACSQNIRKTEEAVGQAKIRYEELLKQQTQERKAVSDAERITVPETHSWLYQIYEGSYKAPLREVLPLVVPGFPITYAIGDCVDHGAGVAPGDSGWLVPTTAYIDECINPVVHSTPTAVTYKDHLDSLTLQANVGYQFLNGVLLINHTVTREYEIPIYGGGAYKIKVGTSNLATGDSGSGGADLINDMDGDIVTITDIHNLVRTSLGISGCEASITDSRNLPAPARQAPPSAARQDTFFTGRPDESFTGRAASLFGGRQEAPVADYQYAPVPVRNAAPVFECYQIAPSGNLLTITARPQRLAVFEPIYESWLESVTRQAIIKITTIQLDVTELAQQKVDISVVRNATIAGTLDSITSNVASRTVDASGSVLSVRIDDPGSPWNTSNIIMQALDSIGDASIEDTRELLIYNNRMVTLRDFVVTRYVSQISIERTDSGNTSRDTPTVQVGELETGQAINILPTLTDSLIAMHIVVNEARIDGFRQYNLLGTSGALPQNSGKDTIFDVTLRDNEAVLLASTTREEHQFSSDESGILPVWPLNRIGPNAEEGRRRMVQTLYLIEGSFKK